MGSASERSRLLVVVLHRPTAQYVAELVAALSCAATRFIDFMNDSAEEKGFEPLVDSRPRRFSKPLP